MAMNKARRTANLNNILTYDTLGNSTLIANLTVEGLTGAGFVKADAAGLLSVDTAAYTVVTGATNYLTKITAPNTLGQSLVYDNGTSVLVNTAVGVPGYSHAFQVMANGAGGLVVSTTDVASAIGIVNSSSANKTWDISPYGNHLVINESGVATRMKFDAGGNITIGDITNTGHKLEVVGSFRTTGTNTLSALQGVGDRMVVANTNGVLTTQPIPTGSITGTGAAGQVNFWTGTTTVSGSNNLFWDNANGRLGIGTNAPNGIWSGNNRALQILSPSNFSAELVLSRPAGTFSAASVTHFLSGGGVDLFGVYSGSTTSSYVIYTNNNERLRIWTNGNALFGGGNNPSDLGVRLGVVGDTILRGSGNTSATTALTVQNSAGTNIFAIRNDGLVSLPGGIEALGVGSYIFSQGGFIFGATTAGARIGASANNAINVRFSQGSTNYLGAYGSGIGNSAYLFSYPASNNTDANTNSLWGIVHTFNPTSGTSGYIMAGLQPTINQTGGANGITIGLHVNPILTAAADWRSIQWSNNTGWGLYGAGTANNYLAGNLSVGTLTTTDWVNIGASTTTKAQIFLTAGVDPTTPTDGDIWATSTDIKARVAGTTYSLINSGLSGSGAAGQVTYWNSASGLTGSANLFWDNTNGRLGIGTNAPAYKLEVSSSTGSASAGILVKNTGAGVGDFASINFINNSNIFAQVFHTSSSYTINPIIGANGFGHYTDGTGGITLWAGNASGIIKFATGTAFTSGSQRMTVFANGNVGIGSGNTDLGTRLGVVGDTLLRGSGNTSGTTALTVQNSASTDLLTVRNDGFLFNRYAAQIGSGNNVGNGVNALTVVGYGSYTFNFNNSTGFTFGQVSLNDTYLRLGGSVVFVGNNNFNPSSDLFLHAGWYSVTASYAKVRIGTAFNSSISRELAVFDMQTMKAQISGIIEAGSVTSTNGSVILRGNYTSGYLTTLGTDASSGGPMLSYGIESAQNSTAGAFVSSSAIAIPRSAYVQNGGHIWYTAPSSSTAIGTAVVPTKHMELYNSGNLVLGGGAETAGHRLQVQGSILVGSTNLAHGSFGSINARVADGGIAYTATNGNGIFYISISGDQPTIQSSLINFNSALRMSSGRALYLSNSGIQTPNSRIALLTTENNDVTGTRTPHVTIGETLQNNFPNPTNILGFTSAWRSAFTINAAIALNGQTTSLGMIGTVFNQQIIAPTNNSFLAGVVINPTFNDNTFTGNTKVALGIGNSVGYSIYQNESTAINYLNGTTLIGTLTNDGINKLQVAGSIASTGIMRSDAARTAATNDVSIALLGSNITTYAAGFTMGAAGYGLNAVYAQHEQRFGGNATFDAGNLNGAGLMLNRLAPTAAGTITMNQQAGRIRTMSNLHLQTQIQGNNNITVTHMSGLHIYGHYRTTGTITLTVGDYYGILLADPNEFSTGPTITGTNWGFYQQGAAPNNHFGGKVLIGTTTVGTSPLRISGLPTSAAGLGAGEIWNNGGVLTVV